MTNHYRFGDYQRKFGAGHNEISFNDLKSELETDVEGNPIPEHSVRIKLTPRETYHLIRPYVSVRFMEQVRAVIPLGIYLLLFQILILRQLEADYWIITAGLFAVIAGLMFFMEGLKLGLMPFGTVIGSTLPRNSPLPVVLFITLLLGIGVTFAEPAIGALKAAGKNVSVNRLVGTEGDFGSMIGLDKEWAVRAIGAVGNYAEIFERNIGVNTSLGLARGLNAQWTQGGILYAPPVR